MYSDTFSLREPNSTSLENALTAISKVRPMGSHCGKLGVIGLTFKTLARIGILVAIAAIAPCHSFAAAEILSDSPIDASASPRRFTLGQRPFSATSSWNRPIATDTTYEKIDWPSSSLFGVAWSSYSPAVHEALDSHPLVSVKYPAGWGYAGGILKIRMPIDADGAPGTDGELLVIEGETIHNFWQFKRHDPTEATALSYGATNVLTGSGWGRASPFLGAGIVAAGASQLAGLLIQAETDRGEIEHALQISIDSSLAKPGHSGEAISGDGKHPDGLVREGQRLTIPPATPMPHGLSPLGQKVFRAFQRYGAFVVDVAGGVTNIRAQANAYDPETIAALRRDFERIGRMLERVRQENE